MDAFSVDFDIEIANSIDINFTKQLLNDFPNIRVLDVEAFEEINKYEPIIASIFIVSNGGSYTLIVNKHHYSILNGTLFCYSKYWIEYSKQMNYKKKSYIEPIKGHHVNTHALY